MAGTVDMPGARPPTEWEIKNREHLAAISRIISDSKSNEEAVQEFDKYAAGAVMDGTLFNELPAQYASKAVVHKPYTVNGLRKVFERELSKAGDIASNVARTDGSGKWNATIEQANAMRYALINDIRSGNGSFSEARVENIRNLYARALRELNDAFFDTTLGTGSGAPIPVLRKGADKKDYDEQLKLLRNMKQSLDKDINDALVGRGVTGRRDVYGEDGSFAGRTNIVEENAGYMRPARILYEGGYLTRGITKKAAKQMLEQALESTDAGGYTYVTYVSQCAGILASDRFKKSGVSVYGLSSIEAWQCAKNVLKAANEMLDEYQGKHVGGTGFSGKAQMASADKEFNDSLASIGVSVNDLSRPMGKDEDIFSSRAIDAKNYGASMYLAGKMFYSKLSVGARMFGNMDYSMKAGDHPTVLLNWRRASPDIIKDAKQRQQYDALKQSVEYYQGIYDNLRTMLTSLYDKGDVNAGRALAVYYNSDPPWEAPADIKAWEGFRTSTTQQIIDEAKAKSNAISGAGGTEAVVNPNGGAAAASGDTATAQANAFGENELGRYMMDNYVIGGANG